VYVAEVMEAAQTDAARLAEIIRGCRAAVSAEHGLTLSSVVLLRTRTVPKTTSGKIARAWCRKAFVDGTLSALTRWDGDGSDDAAAAAAGEAAVQLEMHSPGPHPGAPGPAGTNLYTVTEEPGPADGPGGAEARRGLSVEEVRALPLPDIVAKLESTLRQIAAQGPAPLTGAVDPRASLLALGLDSFTIVQFKGVIEKRFYCDIPDEFLFIQTVNLHEIAVSVKHGSLTPEQRRMVDGAAQAGGGAPGPGGPPGAGGGRAAVVASQKQPMCPWCVCCY
jgi:acyl carrier protein